MSESDAEKLKAVKQILAKHESTYRKAAGKWKYLYRLLLMMSAIFSTSSAIVAQMDAYYSSAPLLAAIFAGVTTVITMIIASLDFETNWRINRRSRHDVCILTIEAEKTGADPDSLLTQLQKIIKQRVSDLHKQD